MEELSQEELFKKLKELIQHTKKLKKMLTEEPDKFPKKRQQIAGLFQKYFKSKEAYQLLLSYQAFQYLYELLDESFGMDYLVYKRISATICNLSSNIGLHILNFFEKNVFCNRIFQRYLLMNNPFKLSLKFWRDFLPNLWIRK